MTQNPALTPLAVGVQVFEVSSQLTLVVHVNPQLFVVLLHEPKDEQAYMVQNDPVPPSVVTEIPHGVPDGAYAVLHLPAPSHFRPQVGSDVPVHTLPGSVPAAASSHFPSLPALLHALHPPLQALSQQ